MSARSALADRTTPKTGRPLWWVAGLSLSLLLVVAGLTWVALRPDTYRALPPATPTDAVRPAEAARSLQLLEEAVTARDVIAAAALAPGDDEVAQRLLSSVVGNAAALRVRDFSLRYVDQAGALAPDGTWTAAVDMSWSFAAYDERPARAELLVSFASTDSGTPIVGLGGGDRVTPVWLSGAVTVRRTPRVLVVVAGTEEQVGSTAERYLRQGEAALPVVARVLPDWRGPLVLEVAGSQAQFDAALDAEPGVYAGIAAVTTTSDLSGAPGAPVHVVVNPAELDRLRARGAQIVISHEATHVATDAASSREMPQWLLEGFADYVALRDVDLPDSRTAAQVIAQVREDGLPTVLPGAAEFDAGTGHAGAAYEAAWLACRVLAERGGEAALVRFYEDVRDGAPVADALGEGFSWTEARLITAWRGRLADVAS